MLEDMMLEGTGEEIYNLIKRLYPICRSITGEGVRESLNIIKEYIPLNIKSLASGTKVFDWTIPKEWSIRQAYIKNSKGEKFCDFSVNNLNVVNYSIPINTKMKLEELKKYIHTIPAKPDWIPYVTSYYKENWGFCMSYNEFIKLQDDDYEVYIDSELIQGELNYGEVYLEGECKEEFLISTYICHPSLCNDNLTGPALITHIIKELIKHKHKYSYRFLFVPETIGAISWLANNEDKVEKIKYGIVATCLGDSGKMMYKRSKRGNTDIDRIVEKVFRDCNSPLEIINFFPWGSDERQFCSPGFNLPVGSLTRSMYSRFPEYHTSGDNLNFVKSEFLQDSFIKYMMVIFYVENNNKYININPKCEPQLGKRGLYRAVNDRTNNFVSDEYLMLTLLSYSDGQTDLLDISNRSGMSFINLYNNAKLLEKAELLKLS